MKPIPVIILITTIGATTAACIALAPGAEQVRTTRNAADVAGCKAVGNVSSGGGNGPIDVLHDIQNQAIGLGGNVVFLTAPFGNAGIAYHCD